MWRRLFFLMAALAWAGVAACAPAPASTVAPTRLESSRPAAEETPGPGATVAPFPTTAPAPAGELSLKLPTGAVKQHGELTLSAEGFAPNEEVLLAVTEKADGQLKEVTRVQANENGQVPEQSVALPWWLESGSHRFEASGTQSRRTAGGALWVRSDRLWAVPSTYSPVPGSRLGFVAGGFEPGEQVAVFLQRSLEDQLEPLAQTTTDQAGNTPWTEFVVPPLQDGEHHLVLEGQSSGLTHDERISLLALVPQVELSPWAGPPGSRVQLNLRGFLPGELVRVFVADDREPTLKLTADQYGDIWGAGPVEVPASRRGGDFAIVVEGEQSGARVAQVFAVVRPQPWAELTAWSGPPGTGVAFMGGGFAAREPVQVHLGSREGPVVATGMADENGRLAMTASTEVTGAPALGATRPEPVVQRVPFVLIGEQSGAEATATFQLIAPPVPGVGG